MKKQNIEKQNVKNYWEDKTPQTWYSNKDLTQIFNVLGCCGSLHL